MRQDELEIIAKGIEDAYKKLEETISQIGKLKEFTNSLSIVSSDIDSLFKSILSNKRLLEFQSQNYDTTNELKGSIEKINQDINKILAQRNNFVEMIETYDQRFQKFENMVRLETETTEKFMRTTRDLMNKLETDQKTLNSRMDRFNKIANSAEIISKFDELNKEIKQNNHLINKLLSKNGNSSNNTIDEGKK
jgi:DNA repair ATPase RecN